MMKKKKRNRSLACSSRAKPTSPTAATTPLPLQIPGSSEVQMIPIEPQRIIVSPDLWRGILLCDLSHAMDDDDKHKHPCRLRYVPLPVGPSEGSPINQDARLCRDIAGHFRFVRHRIQWKNSSLLDDSWQLVCDMDSSAMDVRSSISKDFQLLPKLIIGDNNNPPFQRLDISNPTLIPHTDAAVRCKSLAVHVIIIVLAEKKTSNSSRNNIIGGFTTMHVTQIYVLLPIPAASIYRQFEELALAMASIQYLHMHELGSSHITICTT